MSEYSFLVIIATLLFSAFFSGMEIAFLTSNKLKIELNKKGGDLSARIYSYFTKHEGAFISTLLVGNNIALVIYGYFMALILDPIIVKYVANPVVVLLIQTVLSTALVLVTAEFLPKTIFRINPNRTLKVFAFPTVIFYGLLSPIVFVTLSISNFILKQLLKVKPDESGVQFGKVDLDQYLREATSNANNAEELEHEVQILQNALEFNEVKVRECMVPRTEVIALEENEAIETAKNKFIETGLSKILIFRNEIDNIIGYIHSFELLKQPSTIKEILLPVSLIPEAMVANEALKELNKNKRSMAVVLDEFGGTAGIVTIEDLVEEIVGEIEDEHDKELLVEQDLGDGRYRFSARNEVDSINQKFNLDLPESSEYETLGGLIIHHHERIPESGESLQVGKYHFTIEQVSENKIERILVADTDSE